MKINVFAFALAFGIWWAFGLFIATWWIILTGGSADSLATVRELYIGYSVTPVGSLVGLAEGFVCGTISGAILAWLYNFLTGKVGSKSGETAA